MAGGSNVTPEQLARYRRDLDRAVRGRRRYRYRFIHPDGKARRRPPLPWKVRARLAARRTVDTVGAWLCYHGHGDAALWLWRLPWVRAGKR